MLHVLEVEMCKIWKSLWGKEILILIWKTVIFDFGAESLGMSQGSSDGESQKGILGY